MTPAERINTRRDQIRAAALAMDTSRTEEVTASELCEEDVITAIGPKPLPFPFTLSQVRRPHGVVVLNATHGWFTVQPLAAGTPVTRVVTDDGEHDGSGAEPEEYDVWMDDQITYGS